MSELLKLMRDLGQCISDYDSEHPMTTWNPEWYEAAHKLLVHLERTHCPFCGAPLVWYENIQKWACSATNTCGRRT